MIIKREGLNVKMREQTTRYQREGDETRNALANYLQEDRAVRESKMQEEDSPSVKQ